MAEYDYDLLVLGAGPGGYVAAIRATQLGLKAGVIEKDKPGGVCLNIGCIPSKALIHQAELMRGVKELEAIGVKVDASSLDYSKVFAQSRKAADMLSRGVGFLLKNNKIDLIEGEGVISSAHQIQVKGHGTVSGGNLLIATGSRPRSIPGFDFDEKTVLSSTGALMLERLPKRICVLGGGAIGVEFAHIMNAFGVEVHLVEMLEHLLPLEDEEAVQVLVRSFKKRGIKIYTSTKATGYKQSGKALKVSLEGADGKEELEAFYYRWLKGTEYKNLIPKEWHGRARAREKAEAARKAMEKKRAAAAARRKRAGGRDLPAGGESGDHADGGQVRQAPGAADRGAAGPAGGPGAGGDGGRVADPGKGAAGPDGTGKVNPKAMPDW